MKAPQRGEVWLVDLGLAAKVRPALVLSVPAEDIDRAFATLIPHTTSPRGSRFEASVSVPFLRAGVFDAQNLVTIPHAKLVRRLGVCCRERKWSPWNGQSPCGSGLPSYPPRRVSWGPSGASPPEPLRTTVCASGTASSHFRTAAFCPPW